MTTTTMADGFGKRALKKVKREGIFNTLFQIYLRFESSSFDKKYGVDTHRNILLENLDISADSVEYGRQYQPIFVKHLSRILKAVKPTKDDVLVDFGSGKGRVLLISATYPFKKVVGVEFSEELCSIAEKNVEIFKSKEKLCPIEIHCIDAGKYEIKKEETILFFFNPFEKVIMQKVIENIERSYFEHPRKIKIVYFNLKSQDLRDFSKEFKLVLDTNLNGIDFQMYETK
jgi:16S rRNA G966 N2-methylase RsmD